MVAVALAAPIVAGADAMKVQRGNYRGWADTYTLTNGLVEIAITTAVGPRIVDFHLAGGDNVFYLRAAEVGKSGEATWQFRGGWRLWIAPEEKATTYTPDNQACVAEQLGPGSVRVTGPPQSNAGIQKSVEVALIPNQPRVRIISHIKNVGNRPMTYAAWSLSVMRPGGRALVPFDVGDPTSFSDTRQLNLWSYAKLADPRYRFGDRLIQVDQSKVPEASPAATGRRPDESKIGVDSKQGWAAYLRNAVLYVKRFPQDSEAAYPDGGCTIEIYSSGEFIEVENLSPLINLAPGDEIVYPEEWSLFTGVAVAGDEAEALRELQKWLVQAPPIRH
jgi:hypothetical protein